MRGASVWPIGTLRPDRGDQAGTFRGDDSEGFRRALSRNRWRALWPSISWLDRLLHEAEGADADSGTLPRGGQRSSRARRADGGALGEDSGPEPHRGPCFAQDVPPGGYVWWYVDALSDDGAHALTLIAFIGSVFSPYYAVARKLGGGDPLNHCALNVALYGARKRWALTERTRADLWRSDSALAIGPSRLDWDGTTLTVAIDEITVPWPSRVRGTVRVTPAALVEKTFALDGGGKHRWQPIAPCARVEVSMSAPELRWSGDAYLDCNFGEEPLEKSFVRWDWARLPVPGGTAVLYDASRHDGTDLSLALRLGADGDIEAFPPPPRATLPSTLWGIGRQARSDDGAPVVVKALEDTPFYARSLIRASLFGRSSLGMHESLSLDRVAHPVVRAMLPFRMPRRRAQLP
jgi:carotenoid 1,2-hydratase